MDDEDIIDLKYDLDDLIDKITDKQYNDYYEKIIEGEIKNKGVKSILRKEMGKKYEEKIGYTMKLDKDKNIITDITDGSTNPLLNNVIDEFIKLKGDFGKRLETSFENVIKKNGGEVENNDKHPEYSKFDSKRLDKNGRIMKQSEFLPYDLNVKNKDEKWEIDEIKNYIDPKTQEKIKEVSAKFGDGVFLQKAKILPPRYTPFFNTDKKGKDFLENIYDKYYNSKKNTGEYSIKYVNNRPYYSLKVKYLLPDGLYELDLMDFKLFDVMLGDIFEPEKKWNNDKKIFEETGKILKTFDKDIIKYDDKKIFAKFENVIDGENQESLWINKKHLKKIS